MTLIELGTRDQFGLSKLSQLGVNLAALGRVEVRPGIDAIDSDALVVELRRVEAILADRVAAAGARAANPTFIPRQRLETVRALLADPGLVQTTTEGYRGLGMTAANDHVSAVALAQPERPALLTSSSVAGGDNLVIWLLVVVAVVLLMRRFA